MSEGLGDRRDPARHWLDLAARLRGTVARDGWVPPALESALRCCTDETEALGIVPRTRLLSLLCESPHATPAPPPDWIEARVCEALTAPSRVGVLLPWPAEERRDGRFGPAANARLTALATRLGQACARIEFPHLGVVLIEFDAGGGSAAELEVPRAHSIELTAPDAITAVVITKGERPEFLAEAIRSVLEQSAPPEEVIVVEDGNRSETATLIRGFGSRIRHLPASDSVPRGQAAAMNRAIAETATAWIAWLDDDDRWAPMKLAHQRARQRGDLELIGTAYAVQDEGGRTLALAPPPPLDRQPALRLLLHGSLVTGPSLLVRRALYGRVGGYDESFDRLADYEFLSRALQEARLEVIPLPLTWVRRHAGNRRGPEIERAIAASARRVLLRLRTLPLDRLFPESADDPARSRALLERGAACWRQGLVAEAEADFEDAARFAPGSTEPRLLQARLFLAERRLDDAERCLEIARGLAPGQLAVWLGTGLVAAARERWQEAEEAFGRALAIDPHHPVARTNLILHRFRVPGLESPLAIEVEAMTRDLLLRLRPSELGFSLLELDDPALQRPFGSTDLA